MARGTGNAARGGPKRADSEALFGPRFPARPTASRYRAHARDVLFTKRSPPSPPPPHTLARAHTKDKGKSNGGHAQRRAAVGTADKEERCGAGGATTCRTALYYSCVSVWRALYTHTRTPRYIVRRERYVWDIILYTYIYTCVVVVAGGPSFGGGERAFGVTLSGRAAADRTRRCHVVPTDGRDDRDDHDHDDVDARRENIT